MDGRASTAPIARLLLAGCLALTCWIALRVWTPDEHNLTATGEGDYPAFSNFDAAPPGQPLIDWSLFRFPTLEVTLDDAGGDPPASGGNLLSLLEPQPTLMPANVDSFAPELKLDLVARSTRSTNLSMDELDRLAAITTGVDAWFSDNGLYHPWSILGMNTGRAWVAVGRWWASHVPSDFGAATGDFLIASQQRIGTFVYHRIRATPLQFVGPRLSVEPDDRLAMASPIAQQPTLADDFDAITFAEPTMLLAQIERLAECPWSATWAKAADREIRRLCLGSARDPLELKETLEHLSRLTREARELSAECNQEPLRMQLMQAHYGLARRLNRWQLAADLHWRPTNLWAHQSDRDTVLARQRFALRGPIVGMNPGTESEEALDAERRSFLADAVDVAQLTADLERLESTGSPHAARLISAGQRQLGASTDDRHRQIASEIEEHYRNANFRVAVSGELLNRWLPEQPPVTQGVRDRITGSPVRGQSRTETDLFIRLVPDPFIWRVGLEAKGEVAALTTSGEGSVTVRSQGATSFEARKLLLVRADGVQAWPAIAKADVSQRLLGISSSYDQVPLMGNYIRSQATEEYHRRREQARREVEAKVSHRARAALDEQTEAWIAGIEQQIRTRALQRAEELDLEVTPIELRTTDSRLIARLRLASVDQLAAYTPRPQAPADSLFSVQLHETALNNAMQGLRLGARRLTSVELADLLAEKLNFITSEIPETARRTTFQFADDAVQLRFEEGRLHVTLAIREMLHDRSAVRDFKVHAYYRPEVEGISAKLVRDGSLQMEGRLRHSDRARLHAVFGKALAENSTLELVRLPDDADTAQRLAGLMVTQLVIDDGWLGLSIGPEAEDRTAVRTRYVR
ncbi:MAG: hypothetical protein WD851_02520 [Pirellulales bacterium]